MASRGKGRAGEVAEKKKNSYGIILIGGWHFLTPKVFFWARIWGGPY